MSTTDLHLKLPEPLLAGLEREARYQGLPRAHLLREAVAEYLTRAEAKHIADEMAAYVEEMAPYSGEFVAETDEHVTELLLRETEW